MPRHPAALFATGLMLLLVSLGQAAIAAQTTTPAPSQAATIRVLQAQVQSLTQRLEQLERASARREVRVEALDTRLAQTARQEPAGSSWADRIRIKGDMRYRHEYTDDENRNIRNRERIRARASLVALVNEAVEVGLGLASGGTSAISTNQTLGNGFSTKGLGLDLAYARWSTPVEGLKLSAGKFKNPLHRAGGNGLIWDGDLRPEGLALNYSKDGFFANAATLWVDEVSQDDDVLLLAGQLGWGWALDEGKLTAGAGYYLFTELEDATPASIGGAQGNLLDTQGRYPAEFNELELFAEYSFNVADHPVFLFADYVKNLDADDFDTAFAVGGRWEGKAYNHKTRLEYVYQDLEANSVLGAFADSDFARGGTDASGHILKGTYWFTNAINLKATLFLNDTGAAAGSEADYSKLFLDLSFKY